MTDVIKDIIHCVSKNAPNLKP